MTVEDLAREMARLGISRMIVTPSFENRNEPGKWVQALRYHVATDQAWSWNGVEWVLGTDLWRQQRADEAKAADTRAVKDLRVTA